EMEADDGGPELFEYVGGFQTERRAADPRDDGVPVQRELLIERYQRRSPGRFALGGRVGWRVAEEVNVVRADGLRLNIGELSARRLDAQQGAWKRAQSASARYGNR